MSEAAALATTGLEIGYPGDGGSTTVASGLALSLRAGQFACLIGPNGAGKSTLLRTLAGLQAPLAGAITIAGRAVAAMSAAELARSRALVLTDRAETGALRVGELVALGRYPHTGWLGRLGPQDHAAIDAALRQTSVEELVQRPLAALSDGERQRAAIARALAQEPRVLMLDEPTAFLDLPHRVRLMRLMRDLARAQGLAILLSTHDLDLAMRCADQLWLMPGDGQLAVGAPEELALTGALADAFHGDGLRFDGQAGGFRLEQPHTASCRLTGDGEARDWTLRMLERLGYQLASDTDTVIDIQTSTEGTTWHLTRDGTETTVTDLTALAGQLSGPGFRRRDH